MYDPDFTEKLKGGHYWVKTLVTSGSESGKSSSDDVVKSPSTHNREKYEQEKLSDYKEESYGLSYADYREHVKIAARFLSQINKFEDEDDSSTVEDSSSSSVDPNNLQLSDEESYETFGKPLPINNDSD